MARLVDLLCGYRYEEEFSVGDHKIKMQTLWKEEEIDVIKSAQGLDMYGAIEAMKVPTLARSIMSIDNVPFSAYQEVMDELKKQKSSGIVIVDTVVACEKVLSEMDGGLVDILYSFYLKLKNRRDEERAKLANFTQPQKPGESSSSAASSSSDQKS